MNAGTGRQLRVDVLGPLVVSVDGRPVDVTAGRLRAMVAMLALSAGGDVSVDRLADLLFGGNQPADVRRTVQIYVVRLRRLLGHDLIHTVPNGYRLRVDPDAVDAVRFDRMLEAAKAAGGAATERARLREALALWRGTPFEGVRSAWLEGVEGPRLQERYIAALERRIELDLAAGQAGGLVAELRVLTARYPLRERLWQLLMTALYHAGRQAEALAAYQQLYRLLAIELGVEPSHGIRDLHRRILSADTALRTSEDGATSEPDKVEAPDDAPIGSEPASRWRPQPVSQLPRAIGDFIGRTAETRQLIDALTRQPSVTAVCSIDGMAGAGKSALAVHVAQLVRDAYPDGTLFVDLHGHTADRTPRTAAETLDHLLRVVGVPGDRIPDRMDERVTLWRTLTADRCFLIVLDNVVNADQVWPLIPGGAGCSVLTTSRRRLVELDVTLVVSLEPMPATEAVALFCGTSGASETAAGVQEVLNLCAGLPLAIRIAGMRLRHRSAWSPAVLASRLREEHDRLSELTVGDKGVAAAFELSYRLLTATQQRVFRALGVHPGQQADAPAVAAGCDLPVAAARTALEDLVDAHLLAQPLAGRYQMHDLLRIFAKQRAAQRPAETRQVLERILTYLGSVADEADRCAYPHRHRMDVPTAVADVPAFASAGAALEWFDSEVGTLLAASRMAYEYGLDDHAWRIPVAAWGCFSLRSQWREWIASHHIAVAAAERVGNQAALGHALSGLGVAFMETGAHESAIACYERAIAVRRELGDDRGAAGNLGNLAVAYADLGRIAEAIECAERAAGLSRSVGDTARVAATVTNLGEMKRRAGDLEGAQAALAEAVALARQLACSHSESIALGYLAAVHNDLKEYEQAVRLGEQALELLVHSTNDRFRIADILIVNGHAARALGDAEAARQRWQRALEILTDLGHTTAAGVRTLLGSLPPPEPVSR